MMYEIGYLEMLITQLCNQHCDGCDAYCNYTRNIFVPIDEGKEMINMWSYRIKPKIFRFLGGEPLLHNHLIDYIHHAAKVWPESERWVVTNGTMLERQPDLAKNLSITNTRMHVSFHSSDPRYIETMQKNIPLLKEWMKTYGVRVTIKDHRQFQRFYTGIGKNMRPYQDKNPIKSWENCISKGCLNLKHSRLYKCSAIAHLEDALKTLDIHEHPSWSPYLTYKGVGIEASDDELVKTLLTKPEYICSMCPAEIQPLYYKDIFNVNFDRPELNYFEWKGKQIDMVKFVNTVMMTE